MGKLKLAGTAASGVELFLYFDEQPFARVMVDGDGRWGVEGELRLDDKPHTFRAEQYDPASRMLTGRAMVSIGRTPQAAPAPAPGTAKPEGATP
jgi:hypothetical protein